MEARVFGVIDDWDSLSSPRPYREAWLEKKIHRFIRDQAGTQFDPQVVKIWERVFQIPGKAAGVRISEAPVSKRDFSALFNIPLGVKKIYWLG